MDRVRHAATMSFLSSHPHEPSLPPLLPVDSSHIDTAMAAFTPASLKGAGLFESSVSWSDIGGLHEVREEIKKTLEWPSKYSFLYRSCPLRLRSGMLLYGPPGYATCFHPSSLPLIFLLMDWILIRKWSGLSISLVTLSSNIGGNIGCLRIHNISFHVFDFSYSCSDCLF